MTRIAHSGEFMIPCPYETTRTPHVTHPSYYPLSEEDLEALINYAGKNNNRAGIVEHARAVIRIIQAVPGMECPYPVDDDAGVGNVVTAIESIMANWTTGNSPHSVIGYLIRNAGRAQND